jgi:hypothetical protein
VIRIAERCINIHGVADRCADEGAAERGFIGNETLQAVRLRGADDRVLDFLIICLIVELHLASDVDRVDAGFIFDDDFDVL